jgi:anti-sigma B factor antagonist
LRSAHRPAARSDFPGSTELSGVDMHDALDLSYAIAGNADPPSPNLVCSWTDGGLDAAWVQVAGELDMATVPQLERTLREPQLQARLVVLDLRELEFMDSSGAHALVDHAMRARQAGRRLVILRGQAIVERMLTLSGCSRDLEIGDIAQVESAVAALLQLVDEEPPL